MAARHRTFFLCGAAELPPAPWPLRAGPVEMTFDPATAFLRRLRVGRVELVRGIYGAVRDRDWGTVLPAICNLSSEIGPDSFALEFDADCRATGIHFRWHGRILGQSDGRVGFDFDGEACASFLKNRIGLCVLHPIAECAGQPCTVEHMDGRVTHGAFPRLVAPHQPFKGVRGITHEPAPGLRVEVRLGGETFEMEDQRNWTDASFKTYSTPLELPFPVEITAGTRVRQNVIIHVTAPDNLVGRRSQRVGEGPGAPRQSSVVRLVADQAAARPLPPIGLGVASHGVRLTARERERLGALRLAHLRVDVRFSEPTWLPRFHQAATDAAALGVALEVALFLTGEAERELRAIIAACQSSAVRVARWLVLHAEEKSTSRRWIELALCQLRSFTPDLAIAAGTDANFAELNRQPPPSELGVLPCFSLNPQVHAFDHDTLVENLAAQSHAVAAARAFSGRQAVVSPITLRPRFNAVATAKATPASAAEPPFAADTRQASLFGAAWTLGSLAALATSAEVHSLTYFETSGWRGVMEGEAGRWQPERFPSRPGEVFPVWHVFAALPGFGEVFPLRSDQPLGVVGLGLRNRDGPARLLLANLTGANQAIEVASVPDAGRVLVLDETTVDDAMRRPIPFNAACGHSTKRMTGGGRHHLIRLELRRWGLALVDVG